MNVIIAGMVRAGSMWTYNVTRASIHRMGISLVPDRDIPINEMDLLRIAFDKGISSKEYYCIKSHEYLPLNIPNTKYICNYRDVRDAMLSHMRFMHLSFDQGLEMVQAYINLTDHYCNIQRGNVLRIKYDQIVSNPLRIIKDINQFLGFEIDKKNVKLIARQFAKTEVRKILRTLSNVRLDVSGSLLSREQEKQYTSAPNVDGTHRAYHRKTGFSENHITFTTDGEWRAVFTKEQQDRLMEISRGWLLRYGFDL